MILRVFNKQVFAVSKNANSVVCSYFYLKSTFCHQPAHSVTMMSALLPTLFWLVKHREMWHIDKKNLITDTEDVMLNGKVEFDHIHAWGQVSNQKYVALCAQK